MNSKTGANKAPQCLVIAVYFGPLPSYFDIFLRSVELNQKVDFLLVTDQAVDRLPANVRLELSSLDEFRAAAVEALGMEVAIPRAYKVCDFRPAFGHIFREEVRGYSHWGHCDLDVVFGDILGSIPPEAFESESKILIRGCFALYPNTPQANSWYTTVLPDLDYRHVFSTPNPFHFDESAGILRILQHLGVRIWNEECIFNIEWEHFRLRAGGSRPGYHTYVWRDGCVLEYSYSRRSGLLVRQGLLIHLMKRPMTELDFDAATAKEIYIGPDRFSASAESFRSYRTLESRVLLAWYGLIHQLRRIRRRVSKRGELRPLA